MIILDGKIVAASVKESVKAKAALLIKEHKKTPHLAAILIGTNGASETYVANKVKTCEEIGFKSTLLRFDENVKEQLLLDTIQKLNVDDEVDGILVQLPLPKHISEEKVINTINPSKDVDGFHPSSIGKLVQGCNTLWYYVNA